MTMSADHSIQSILVCTGGSSFADQAVTVAGQLSRSLSARLTVLTIQDPHEPIDLEGIQAQVRKLLNPFHLQPEIKQLHGHAAKEILAESERGYDLTILGSHGKKGLVEFFLGDTAVHVVDHLKRSTLIVRPPGEMNRILLCLRLGKERAENIGLAASVAKATGSTLTLLYVLPLPIMYGMHVRDNLELMGRHPMEANYLQKLARQVETDYDIHPDLRLRQGIPEEEILEEIRDSDQQMVIVGASDWRGVSRFLLGNISQTIVKHSSTSVLVLVPKRSS